MKRKWIILLIAILVLLLAACGREKEPRRLNQQEVSNLVAAMLMPKYQDPDRPLQAEDKLNNSLRSHIQYSIEEYEKDTVILSLTAPDMKALFEPYLNQPGNPQDPWSDYNRMAEEIMLAMEQPDCPTITRTVTTTIDYTGLSPKLVMTEELMNAISGDMMLLFEEMIELEGTK